MGVVKLVVWPWMCTWSPTASSPAVSWTIATLGPLKKWVTVPTSSSGISRLLASLSMWFRCGRGQRPGRRLEQLLVPRAKLHRGVVAQGLARVDRGDGATGAAQAHPIRMRRRDPLEQRAQRRMSAEDGKLEIVPAQPPHAPPGGKRRRVKHHGAPLSGGHVH